MQSSSSNGQSNGSYNPETKTWDWPLTEDTKMTIKSVSKYINPVIISHQFKGKVYVDIRKLWKGQPTKKGIALDVDTFKRIQEWHGLDGALKTIPK